MPVPNDNGALQSRLLAQAERIAAGLDVFEEMAKAPAAAKAARIAAVKRRADAAAAELLRALEQAPASQRRRMRCCSRELAELFSCVKRAADDMLVFQTPVDENLLLMASALQRAGEGIVAALRALPGEPQACGSSLAAAKRAEHGLQTICRRSVSELVKGPNMVAILKGRELYRRLSDAGAHGAEAAELLAEMLASRL